MNKEFLTKTFSIVLVLSLLLSNGLMLGIGKVQAVEQEGNEIPEQPKCEEGEEWVGEYIPGTSEEVPGHWTCPDGWTFF